jgi:hypothetical protein
VPEEVKVATTRRAADLGAEAKNQENLPENENGEVFSQARIQRSNKVLAYFLHAVYL